MTGMAEKSPGRRLERLIEFFAETGVLYGVAVQGQPFVGAVVSPEHVLPVPHDFERQG